MTDQQLLDELNVVLTDVRVALTTKGSLRKLRLGMAEAELTSIIMRLKED